MQRKALKKSKKRERREQKNPTTHTYTHTARCFLRTHSYHAKEPTEEESETKRNLNDAPRPYFCLCRSRARDGRPSSPSVGRRRRPVNFSFFSLSVHKNTAPFSKKRGLKFWKRCRALRAIYDAHRFVDAEKNETNETNARRAFV